ncbi:unnamed protein product [Linum tenue]|uniref:Uncharacterized protein n=1 Tax=Linum tenue TaxID=586396 RepID=A0AAV0QY57_9ROSI|nr:unnamed protein product [Linum tenue]
MMTSGTGIRDCFLGHGERNGIDSGDGQRGAPMTTKNDAAAGNRRNPSGLGRTELGDIPPIPCFKMRRRKAVQGRRRRRSSTRGKKSVYFLFSEREGNIWGRRRRRKEFSGR